MNRRILLIDADLTFRTTLTVLLGRYRIDVVAEPDADEAISQVPTEQFELVVIGVDEPEKAGFKIFQRVKKLTKAPIMLVTASVPAESFTKHRSLKAHANEYVDKRLVSKDELLAKIGGVIELGEVTELAGGGASGGVDDLDIPVEVEDIAMDGGDVVDEVIEEGGNGDEFGNEQQTRMGGPDKHVDLMVDADVEDAFGSMMGSSGDDDAGPTFDNTQVAPAGANVIDETNDFEDEHRSVAEPSMLVPVATQAEEAVPGTIHDGGRSDDENFDSFSEESKRPPIEQRQYADDIPIVSRDMIPIEELAAAADADARAHHDLPSHQQSDQPADPDGDPDRDAYYDMPVDETADDADGDAAADAHEAGAAEPVPQVSDEPVAGEPPFGSRSGYESSPAIMLADDDLQMIDEDDLHAIDDEVPDDTGVPEPVHHPRSAEDAAEAAAAREPSRPKHVEAPVPAMAPSMAPPAVAHAAAPVPDLGLDVIAQEARNEQSGVHDRKAVHKISELERQLAQLKTELDRSRASADAATRGGGREREFMNLREKILAAENETKKTRADLVARERELAEAQGRLRDADEQRQSLDAKARELEQRLVEDGTKVQQLHGQEQELHQQLATLRQQLGDKAQGLAAAESAREQLERDLASERALRASSASDAEQALRGEREQLVERHASELEGLRQELAAQHAAAIQQARSDLETQHAGALAAAVDTARRELRAEADEAVKQLEAKHTTDISRFREEQAAATVRARREQDELVTQMQGERAADLARIEVQHVADIKRARDELAVQLVASADAHDRAVTEMTGEIQRLRGDLAQQSAAAEQALAARASKHANELASQANQHAAALSIRERELTAARQEDAAAQSTALSELKAELERQAAQHGAKLDVTRREVDDIIAQHEAAKVQLVEEQRQVQAQLAAQHAEELGRLAADKQRAIDDVQRASAEHRSALERATEEHRAALAQQQEGADREIADLKQLLLGAKRQLEELAQKTEADREASAQTYASALAELVAQHERTMAVANGEIVKVKAVADAEQKRALEAKHAELEAKQAELERVREELAAAHAAEVAQLAASRASQVSGLERARDELVIAHAAKVEQLERTRGELATAHAAELAKLAAAHDAAVAKLAAAHATEVKDLGVERDELKRGLSAARDTIKRSEGELASAVQTIADRNAELRTATDAITERDNRIGDLRKEIESIEQENANYQEQVLRAFQKIKADEAMVSRAKKAMAIALTVLDDQGTPKSEPT